ncbi:Rpn family recombination-promoting nuclease/putative transposase [Sorangium sp. So ce281]|uniref:Rpn family recombination-promoting nuclease/putative transposase n=1 Tax=unclassified Sorangium TaxID=2621164 RepID=UPI003F63EAF7
MQINAHDALFKAAFSQVEHAAGELRQALPPALSARIDFAALRLRPGSFVDEALKERQSDLLFSASMGEARVLLYLLCEHQSTVEPLMAFRLLRYMVRIWEHHLAEHPGSKLLPAILPVVLHHSETGWTAATSFEDLLEVDEGARAVMADHVPRFRFVLDDISQEGDEALKARAMSAFSRLVLWCLRHGREPDELLRQLGKWLDLVNEVRRAPNGVEALRAIWRYILATNERDEADEVLQRLLAAAGEPWKEEIVSAADQLMERGRQQGLREGLREGRRHMLLKVLGARFGALPDDAVARVNAADIAVLDRWSERVLTAPTLAAVLSEP